MLLRSSVRPGDRAMFDPVLRPLKDRALEPVTLRLARVDPNAITAAAAILGLGSAALAWTDRMGPALGLWLANRTLDGLDGAVARRHGTGSDLGGFLDLVSDFVVYAAIPVALALRPGADPALPAAALVLLATFYVNAAAWMVSSAILEGRGLGAREGGEPTTVVIPEGLVSGTETVVLYALFFLVPSRQVLLFQAMAVLTAVTVVQRVTWARREFRSPR